MITYRSTRENKKIYSFSEVILKGIAPDGGLFVPEKIPEVSLKHLQKLPSASYAACALFLLDLFETDFSKNILKKLTKDAYGKDSNFDVPEIISLKNLKENE